MAAMRNGHRIVEPAPVMQPFYTRGNTWRNEIQLKERGWYFMDDRRVLCGPYSTKLDCTAAIEDAKYVEAR